MGENPRDQDQENEDNKNEQGKPQPGTAQPRYPGDKPGQPGQQQKPGQQGGQGGGQQDEFAHETGERRYSGQGKNAGEQRNGQQR